MGRHSREVINSDYTPHVINEFYSYNIVQSPLVHNVNSTMFSSEEAELPPAHFRVLSDPRFNQRIVESPLGNTDSDNPDYGISLPSFSLASREMTSSEVFADGKESPVAGLRRLSSESAAAGDTSPRKDDVRLG